MIPIRDTIPSQRAPWVMLALVHLNVLVFFWELWQGPAAEAWLYRFGVVPSLWVWERPADMLELPQRLWTLVTSQFFHGGLLHLGSNMLYLWIFGDNVEDRLGHGRFLALYLGCGIVAALTQLFMHPDSSVPMIGASGAIAGVLGAYFLLFPFAKIVTLVPIFLVLQTVEIPAFVFLGFWFVLQWIQGLPALGEAAQTGGVAWWAHVGGFVSGLVLVGWLRRRRVA
ncbi:MAG: rhomboid family intramembrane serine protease [Candidatus Omnitrophica bacterium]|nr:rhomboid family intramembrane serine protease [Candidatus Omnitrophota bacterium]